MKLITLALFLFVCNSFGQWTTLNPGGTIPTESFDFAHAYDKTSNSVFVWGGLVGADPSTAILSNSMYKYDVGANTWQTVTQSGSIPFARYGARMIKLANRNSLLLFGGTNGGSFFNDTYLFNITTGEWTNLIPSASSAYVTPRAYYGIVTISNAVANSDVVYIFGGLIGNPVFTNDFLELDVSTRLWTQREPNVAVTSLKPTPRRSHVCSLISGNNMIVYGGYDSSNTDVNDMWIYDFTAYSWSRITQPNSPPSVRSDSAYAVTIPATDSLFVFGGLGGGLYLNDFYTWNMKTGWSTISATGAPAARRGSMLIYIESTGALICFGGRTSSLSYNDLLRYTPSTPNAVQLYYSIESVSGGYEYIFKLKQIGTWGGGDVNNIIIGDSGTSAPFNAQSLTNWNWVQVPVGFNTQTSTGTHSGPMLSNPNPTGWTPSGINSYIWWSGRATNYISNGKLYWSNVLGSGVRANYLPAMLDCYEANNNNRSRFDKDSDNYSFCNSFNAFLFDCNDTNASQNPSITEVCNGIDDNCRNGVDLDIAVKPLLPLQNGVCAGYNQSCINGNWVQNYSVVPNYGSPELLLCDGLDNDCNNVVDDNLTPPNATLRFGVCSGLTKTCNGTGGWIEPNYTAIAFYQVSETFCDTRDNDCDGTVDNTVLSSRPLLTNQSGICNGYRRTCQGGSYQDNYSVVPGYQSPENSCNLLDDDCDNIVDNIPVNNRPALSSQNGVCAGQKRSCVSGAWFDNYTIVPFYEPVELSCDLKDNNCDGLVDNIQIVNRPLLTIQFGVCSGARKTCTAAGNWSDDYSIVSTYHSPEGIYCDGLDNDCDNVVDNNLVPPLALKQNGVCAGSQKICNTGAGSWGEPNYAAYSPNYQVIETSCDGLDNDCDGVVDSMTGNTLSRQGGPCFGKLKRCVNGTVVDDFSQVVGFEWNETSCDAYDNDCDGIVDNLKVPGNLTSNQLGVCANSRKRCNNGTFIEDFASISGYQAVEDRCDGLDNDCDGQVDENVGTMPALQQQGVCRGSVQICMGSQGWTEPDYSLISGYQSPETSCDSLDNDCDGSTDGIYGNLTSNQNGVCNGTRKFCVAGGWIEDFSSLPGGISTGYSTTETCNGKDDNCNGETDENILRPLATNQNGVCRGSLKICTGITGWQEPDLSTIPGYQNPEPDVCDRIDQNCNGIVDDTASGGCVGITTGQVSTSTTSGGSSSTTSDSLQVTGIQLTGDGEVHNFLGYRMSTAVYYVTIGAIVAVCLTCVVSCVYVIFGKKKKRRYPPGFPYPPGMFSAPPPEFIADMQDPSLGGMQRPPAFAPGFSPATGQQIEMVPLDNSFRQSQTSFQLPATSPVVTPSSPNPSPAVSPSLPSLKPHQSAALLLDTPKKKKGKK